MKKYVDKVEIQNFEEINSEIVEWKKSVLKSVDLKPIAWMIRAHYILLGIGLIMLFVLFTLTFIIDLPPVEGSPWIYGEETPYWFLDFFILVAAFIFWLIHNVRWTRMVKESIKNLQVNPYLNWLDKINKNLIIDKNVDLYMSTSKIEDYKKMKYIIPGTSGNLDKEYEITQGILFNNSFELSCGIWHSSSTDSEGNTRHFYSYLPLLKIKTNLFLDEKVMITNSYSFEHFTNRDIQLEDEEFNKIFSVRASNENIARMILTPIVQNRWKDMKHLPPFNMHIEDGYIKVLFMSHKFMDMELISKLSVKDFKKVESFIWKDISKFVNILNLVFAISIFQFEEIVDFDNLTLD